MVGIGLEIISVVAALNIKIYEKHVTNDLRSCLKPVASDLESIAGSFLYTILIIGTDVSIYVAEVHTGKSNIKLICDHVEKVAVTTPVNSEIVHKDGKNTNVRG